MNPLTQSLLATISFYFHQGLEFVIKALLARQQRRGLGSPAQRTWKTICDQAERPGFLPVLSVLGPRWNCHAALAGLGPIRVERELVCQTADLRARSDSWSLVLYDPQGRTVSWTGSCRTDRDEVTWQLPAGTYTLSLRSYMKSPDLTVPNLIVDGVDYRAARVFAGEGPRYERLLASVRGKTGPYYQLLHYYIFHHLSRSGSRSEEWLRAHFLPVGNPDTDWRIGHLFPGEQLEIQRRDTRNVSSYVAFYNWASFPVQWEQVSSPTWRSPRFEEPVGYAVRLVRTAFEAETVADILCTHVAARAHGAQQETSADTLLLP